MSAKCKPAWDLGGARKSHCDRIYDDKTESGVTWVRAPGPPYNSLLSSSSSFFFSSFSSSHSSLFLLYRSAGRLCSRQGCVPCDHAQSHVVYMQSKCKVVRACLCLQRVCTSPRACVHACVHVVRACVRVCECATCRMRVACEERGMTWPRSWQKLPTFRRKARLLDRDKTRPWSVAKYRASAGFCIRSRDRASWGPRDARRLLRKNSLSCHNFIGFFYIFLKEKRFYRNVRGIKSFILLYSISMRF